MNYGIGKSSLATESTIASTKPSFDPTSFLIVPPKGFDDLKVGDIFRAPSRTLTDAHASAFQAVSADNHPVHYDKESAARHGHPAPVVHGLQVLAFTAPGATLFPHHIGEAFIAFTELPCKFLKEVHAGDTLYSTLEIIDLAREGENGVVPQTSPSSTRKEILCCLAGTNISSSRADTLDGIRCGRRSR
jgi:acyl dehydratase